MLSGALSPCGIAKAMPPINSNWMVSNMSKDSKNRNSDEKVFEPTCAYARWAHMHHFASVCDWTKSHLSKSHISGTVRLTVTKFGQSNNYMGQRSLRSKVTRVMVNLGLILLAGGLISTSSCIFFIKQ